MNIDQDYKPPEESSSLLDISLHNLSLDMTSGNIRNASTNKKSNNTSRILDIKKV